MNKWILLLTMISMVSCGTVKQIDDSKVKSVSDVQLLELMQGGQYLAFCKNNTVEIVVQEDVSNNDVCPNSRNIARATNIRSVESRGNGQFQIVCNDSARRVVTIRDILNGQECLSAQPPPPSPVITTQPSIITRTINQSFAIPDHNINGKNIDINITESGILFQAELEIKIKHAFRGDLKINLIHPDGSVMKLQDLCIFRRSWTPIPGKGGHPR